jgi:DNA-binding NarL/FixJ family response regulator
MNKQETRIALVDDHVLLRTGLAALVESFEGYTVIFQADNGKEFIDMLATHPLPDIILLDITMPEMNGYETAAWLKAHKPDVKILVLSMMDHEAAVISMLRQGARGFILKDSKPVVFKQALDSIRDTGFYMNDLVSNKMLHYITNGSPTTGSQASAPRLTEKEIEFLQLACSEMAYKQIAGVMNVSVRTVDGYRDDLFRKLEVESRVGLVLFAIRNGYYKL